VLTSFELLWLGLPLLVLPWLVPVRLLGRAAAQLVVAGLTLAALWQGERTLDPLALAAAARSGAGDAQFIGITIGALVSGGLAAPWLRHWRALMAGLPLAVGVALVLPAVSFEAFAAGALAGAVPWVVAGLTVAVFQRSGVSFAAPTTMGPVREPIRGALLVAGVAAGAAIAAWAAPLPVVAVLLLALAWTAWWPQQRSRRPLPVLPVLATVLLGGWAWLALTISGTAWIRIPAFDRTAPVSPAAEVLLALLTIGWLLALAPPWPLDRLTRSAAALPALVVAGRAAAVRGVGVGTLHWQPLLTLVLVLSTLAAVVLCRWEGAAAALVWLGATRLGIVGCAGALAIGTLGLVATTVVPRRGDAAIRWSLRAAALVSGLAAAAIVTAVLRDEVVLGVLLGLGLCCAMVVGTARVARSGIPAHL
jgi:hypothetical protein